MKNGGGGVKGRGNGRGKGRRGAREKRKRYFNGKRSKWEAILQHVNFCPLLQTTYYPTSHLTRRAKTCMGREYIVD
jgi:hypothetical protein